jgi:hypothetical protein
MIKIQNSKFKIQNSKFKIHKLLFYLFISFFLTNCSQEHDLQLEKKSSISNKGNSLSKKYLVVERERFEAETQSQFSKIIEDSKKNKAFFSLYQKLKSARTIDTNYTDVPTYLTSILDENNMIQIGDYVLKFDFHSKKLHSILIQDSTLVSKLIDGNYNDPLIYTTSFEIPVFEILDSIKYERSQNNNAKIAFWRPFTCRNRWATQRRNKEVPNTFGAIGQISYRAFGALFELVVETGCRTGYDGGNYTFNYSGNGRKRCSNNINRSGSSVVYCAGVEGISSRTIFWSDVVALEWYDFKISLTGTRGSSGNSDLVNIEDIFRDKP